MKNSGDFQEDLEFQILFSIFIQKKLKIYIYSQYKADLHSHSLLSKYQHSEQPLEL